MSNFQKATPALSPIAGSRTYPSDTRQSAVARKPQVPLIEFQQRLKKASDLGIDFQIVQSHPWARLINEDLKAELLTIARLRYEDLLAAHPNIDPKSAAAIAAAQASDLGERRLACYPDKPHRQVVIRRVDHDRVVCLPRPWCWFPRKCVGLNWVHADGFAHMRSHNWYGQLIKSLAVDLVDANRQLRDLPLASWYELLFVTSVETNPAADWETLIGAVLDLTDRFRKKCGFQWADLLTKRGLTRWGKKRLPIINARTDEWLAEGYIRLVFGNKIQGLWRGKGVVPSIEKGRTPKRSLHPMGRHPTSRSTCWSMVLCPTWFDCERAGAGELRAEAPWRCSQCLTPVNIFIS